MRLSETCFAGRTQWAPRCPRRRPSILRASKFREEVFRSIQTFRAGDVGALSKDAPKTSNGLLTEQSTRETILLSKQMYDDEDESGIAEIHFQTGHVGALIWLRQTRQDIGPAITQIDTEIPDACESPGKAKRPPDMYRKIVRFAKTHRRGISHTFPLLAIRVSNSPVVVAQLETVRLRRRGIWPAGQESQHFIAYCCPWRCE